jgi:hypothetical protein
MSVTAGFLLGSIVTVGLHYLWVTYIRRSITNSSGNDGLGRSLMDGSGEPYYGSTTNKTTSDPRSAYDIVSGVSQSGFLTELVGQLWSYINQMGCQIVKGTYKFFFLVFEMFVPFISYRFYSCLYVPIPDVDHECAY